MLLDLSPGSSPGLGENCGTEFDFEFFKLLLKGDGIVLIAGVVKRNRFHTQSLDIKGKPHGSTS